MSRFVSFRAFYPFYLSEHAQRSTRRLHFMGSCLALTCIALLVLTGDLWWLAGALTAGYGFAWLAHFICEKNKPATFTYPLYSFMGDWVMWWQILTGKIPF